jgi:Leucine-rich repeat (LRR) protein
MKKFYSLLTVVFFAVAAQAQIVNIPDAAFKTVLLNYQPAIDTNNDGEIQVGEAQAVTTLELAYDNYEQELTGIRSFTNLATLTIGTHSLLTTIDLHDMASLQTVTLYENFNVTAINITGLSGLETLYLNAFTVSSLDFTGCANLKTLSMASMTYLPVVNLTPLTNLETLTINSLMEMNSLNLSGLIHLKSISLENAYSLLNVSVAGLTALEDFNCLNSGLTALDMTNLPALKHINVTHNASLASLNCTGSAQLETIDCQWNALMQLLLNGATNLRMLNCSRNNLTALAVSGFTLLEKLDASTNNLAALDLTGLNALTDLSCGSNHIAALNVAPLTGLTSLQCNDNLLTSLNVSGLANLTTLNCSFNNLGTLNVGALTNLTTLYFANTQVSTIDLTNLHNLEFLNSSGNPLNTLNLSNTPNLTDLTCENNNLSALELSQVQHLQLLDCASNQLTALDFNSTNFVYVQCSHNNLTSLDLGNDKISYLDVSYNANLVNINLKNGNPYDIPQFSIYPCPNLVYFCVDEAEIASVVNTLQTFNIQNIQVNSYCTFDPGGNNNAINGSFTYDFENNGCDANDAKVPNVRIGISNGTNSGVTFSSSFGNYSFFTQIGNYTLTPTFPNPYFTVTPPTATLNFAALDQSTQTQNFCIIPLGVHYDVEISIIPLTNARPGFNSAYRIIYQNNGNQIQTGNILLEYNDDILDFVSADPALTSQTTGQLNWAYANLLPFESRYIDVVLNLNGPTETPPVNTKEVLYFTATIQPFSGDQNPNNDVASLKQIVTGSLDPNDKTCVEGNTMTPEKIGDYLHYVIRFQNTGTAPAEFIVVKDIIDTTKFDISSLQLTASSHPQTTRIDGNKVEFFFENVNLPAAIIDEPGSHGFVAFKIKTKNNLVLGNSVSNTAGIYFDYNWPVITNTASTTVALLAKDTFEDKTVSVYPNPVKDAVHVSAKDNITSIQLFDVQGRLIETVLENDREVNFDLGKNTSGVYFLKIYTKKGVTVAKLIKE